MQCICLSFRDRACQLARMLNSRDRLLLLFGLCFAVVLLGSCSNPTSAAAALAPETAFLSDAEEETYSEVLQAKQRIILQIELVDTVRPQHRVTLQSLRGYAVPAGNRRVQFRVVLPSTSLMDSRSREARGFFDVNLVGGHRYRIAGRYEGNARTFRLIDLDSNETISPEIDLGFFGPIRREQQFVPLIIPIKN